MEDTSEQMSQINNLLLGSVPSISTGNTMLTSSYGLGLLFIQAVQHHQNSGQVQITNTAKCIIDILNQGKYGKSIDKVIDTLS